MSYDITSMILKSKTISNKSKNKNKKILLYFDKLFKQIFKI